MINNCSIDQFQHQFTLQLYRYYTRYRVIIHKIKKKKSRFRGHILGVCFSSFGSS